MTKITKMARYAKKHLKKIKPDLSDGIRKLVCLNYGAKKVVEKLSKYNELGIISNEPEETLEPLINSNIFSLFNRISIPSKIKMKKPGQQEKSFLLMKLLTMV